MTLNIKRLLFADSGIFAWLFLTPKILSTKIGISKIDIDFILQYNLLGNILINPLQTILELMWNGLGSFDLHNIIHREEHKQYLGINRNYFTCQEINFLEKFENTIDII
jgi:hypothetical protein